MGTNNFENWNKLIERFNKNKNKTTCGNWNESYTETHSEYQKYLLEKLHFENKKSYLAILRAIILSVKWLWNSVLPTLCIYRRKFWLYKINILLQIYKLCNVWPDNEIQCNIRYVSSTKFCRAASLIANTIRFGDNRLELLWIFINDANSCIFWHE